MKMREMAGLLGASLSGYGSCIFYWIREGWRARLLLLLFWGAGIFKRFFLHSKTPWTVAHQTPPSMEFSRQEDWSGLPFPSPGHLPNPGMEPKSPALQADSLPESEILSSDSEPPEKPVRCLKTPKWKFHVCGWLYHFGVLSNLC